MTGQKWGKLEVGMAGGVRQKTYMHAWVDGQCSVLRVGVGERRLRGRQ